jgi:hypothetical protein
MFVALRPAVMRSPVAINAMTARIAATMRRILLTGMARRTLASSKSFASRDSSWVSSSSPSGMAFQASSASATAARASTLCACGVSPAELDAGGSAPSRT